MNVNLECAQCGFSKQVNGIVPDGARIRCPKCQHYWYHQQPYDIVEFEPEPKPEQSPANLGAAPPVSRPIRLPWYYQICNFYAYVLMVIGLLCIVIGVILSAIALIIGIEGQEGDFGVIFGAVLVTALPAFYGFGVVLLSGFIKVFLDIGISLRKQLS